MSKRLVEPAPIWHSSGWLTELALGLGEFKQLAALADHHPAASHCLAHVLLDPFRVGFGSTIVRSRHRSDFPRTFRAKLASCHLVSAVSQAKRTADARLALQNEREHKGLAVNSLA
jgi:hypothetical protein